MIISDYIKTKTNILKTNNNMSKFISSTFGLISGRHGTAVAMISKSTGKNYLRIHTVPSDPKTAKQLAQRAKFGFVTSEMNCFHNLFKITFGGNQGVSHGLSLAFKAVTGTYPNFSFDYSKLVLSTGGLDITGQVSCLKTTGTTVQCEWDKTIGFQSNDNDAVNLVFFEENDKIGILKRNVAVRSAGNIEIVLPDVWIGHEIHCWIFFSTANDSMNSNSRYISAVQL